MSLERRLILPDKKKVARKESRPISARDHYHNYSIRKERERKRNSHWRYLIINARRENLPPSGRPVLKEIREDASHKYPNLF